MVLADIAALGYRELLYRLEVRDVGEIDILDVGELENGLSDNIPDANPAEAYQSDLGWGLVSRSCF